MVEIVVKIPEELKQEMDKIPVDWSKIARDAIREKAIRWAKLKDAISKSKLTEDDALKLGRKVSRALAERYRKMYSELK